MGGAAPVPVTLTGLPLAKHSHDAAILAAWNVRQTTYDLIRARGTYFDVEIHSPELADIYDDADRRIVETEATTIKGALAQAWVTWAYIGPSHTQDDRQRKEMIRRADFAGLEAVAADLDWDHQCMLQTVRTLRLLAGEA